MTVADLIKQLAQSYPQDAPISTCSVTVRTPTLISRLTYSERLAKQMEKLRG